MSEFKQQLKDNDGSHEIEVDQLTIDNETCAIYYFKDTDAIQIIIGIMKPNQFIKNSNRYNLTNGFMKTTRKIVWLLL